VDYATADLSDAHPEAAVVAPRLGLTDFGGVVPFRGPISTVRCFEDNSLVRAALQESGGGRVLVVDGGGSLDCALVGDVLAALGRDNGWSGVVVNGCVRDAAQLAEITIGIKALTAHPTRSVKRGVGERDLDVTFGGVAFQPGAWLYADADGILVLPNPAD
jgi:regulator of ribonuclease activity A